VEVDGTYYALPDRARRVAVAERTPAGFVFDVKAHAVMTGHPVETARLPRALRDLLPPSAAGATRCAPTSSRRRCRMRRGSSSSMRSPPLARRGGSARSCCSTPAGSRRAPRRPSGCAWRASGCRGGTTPGWWRPSSYAHRDWYAPRLRARTLALLERLELAHVVVDAPPGHASSVPLVPVATHPRLAVVRLHGRRQETWERPVRVVSERYRYRYSPDELQDFVAPVVALAGQAQQVHVVFNNCHADHGIGNAGELTALLRWYAERREAGPATV
jgi:uncharacterized protein YecE (DUF72 family)